MFAKIVSSLEAKALQNASLSCPACGAAPAADPTSFSAVIECLACHRKSIASEWHSKQQRANPDRPPADTKITRMPQTNGAVWDIPATAKGGFLLSFAIFWCAITALISGSFVLTFFKGTVNADPPWLKYAIFLFFGVFWAIGLGCLYAALRHKYATHRLAIDSTRVTLRRTLFGRTSEKSLPRGEVISVNETEFYQQNYSPVYGIEIRAKSAKLRFGSALAEEDRAWLAADMKRILFPEETARLQPHVAKGAAFSIAVPKGVHGISFGIVLILTGIFLGGFVLWTAGFIPAIPRPQGMSGAPGLFLVLFPLIGSLMVLGGCFSLIRKFITRADVEKLEGNATTIALRTYRRGLVLKEKTFPRDQVADIRASVSGNSNGRTMKRADLVTATRAERLFFFRPADAVDEFIAEVRRFL